MVNQRPTGTVVPVTVRSNSYLVQAGRLRRLGVRVADVADNDLVAVDALPEVTVHYDSPTLRLLIDVPAAWLPHQQINHHGGPRRHPARASTGALFNYDVFSTFPDTGSSSTAVWNELRIFGNFGAVSSTGTWRSGGGQGGNGSYIRYDTRWQYPDEDRMLLWEAGDVITRGPAWSNAVRLGGIQLSRDFSVRPDVVTYPLPEFAGEAAVPTAVDLFINGQRTSSTQVDPGPFAITSVPFINGAGNAVMVVTDALGRQVSTSMPFYVSSSLLRPGLSDFSLGAGAIRRGYGIRNASYGSAAAHGSWRYGVTNLLTLEAHGEAAQSFTMTGLGGVFSLGHYGVVNTAYSHSRHAGQNGYQASAGYQYNARRFSFSTQHTRRSHDFTNLSIYSNPFSSLNTRTNTTAAGSVSLGNYGSLGLGYFDVKGFDDSRTRLLNLSYSIAPWRNASLYFSGNREIGGDDWSATAQLVVSLDHDRGSIGGGYERDRRRGNTQRLYYNRPIPSQGGFGWNLSHTRAEDRDDYSQAELSWRNDAIRLRGGVYGTSGAYNRWANATGSLVLMNGSVFAANRITDAFVVVDTNGFPGVPVSYENQLVGTTNSRGRLLVPWASAFHAGRYQIDPMELPLYVQTPLVDQRVAVRRGSGYLLRFPVERVVAASIVLHDAEGEPLPVGALVTTGNGHQAYVGWDGLLYLENLQPRNKLSVRLPDGDQCDVSFELDTSLDQIAQIGPLVCR